MLGAAHTGTSPRDAEHQEAKYSPLLGTAQGAPAPVQLRRALDVLAPPGSISWYQVLEAHSPTSCMEQHRAA